MVGTIRGALLLLTGIALTISLACSDESTATSSSRAAADAEKTSTAVALNPKSPDPSSTAAPGQSPSESSSDTAAESPPDEPTAYGYRLEVMVELPELQWMLGFAPLPGGTEALVATKTGQIWRVSLDGSAQPTLFGDISPRLIVNPHVEEGLLGLALSPAFETDGRVYLHYTAGEPRRGVLSRFTANENGLDVSTEQVLLEVPQPWPNHNGGHIAFGPDGYLYMALGDGGDAFDPQGNGQNLGNLLSTLLRLDVSGDSGYVVPPDNPFAGVEGARPEIYAYGLRNPWRFSFDSLTGTLWAGDVGQDDWEEINEVVPGGNYGWSVIEGSTCRLLEGCGHVDIIEPRVLHARESNNQAIVGGYVYRGDEMPELSGWLIYGDWGIGKVWAFDTETGQGQITLMDTEVPIMSFGQLPNGEVVVVGFSEAIYKLVRD